MRALVRSSPGLLLGIAAGLGCASTPAEPQHPAWADVAPILRGECNGCHGWNAPQTGGGYRFDFYDVAQCGDAALAVGSAPILAGSPLVAPLIKADVVAQGGAMWPRMPPQPSPALPDWESSAIERWAAQPAKGPAPPGNRPPNITVSDYPATANGTLAFTAVIDDPDGDSALGVIEVNGLAFLMDRPGSFAVSFDSSSWPPGPTPPLTAVLCDGWISASYPLGPVQVKH